MGQKYKVFLEDKVIYFTDVELTGINPLVISLARDYHTLFPKIESENQIICHNPEKSMMDFFQKFKFIEAAGGIVKSEDEFLFIKRFGFWDIPKGKMEKKEVSEITAIREIREECGLKGELSIQNKIIDTYHTYDLRNKSVLKKTHWYFLDYSGDKKTEPQLEEGITEIAWLKKNDLDQIKENTFSSITEVLDQLVKFL